MTDPEDGDEPWLDPSGIAQFIKHGRCRRYLKQRFDPGDEPDARDWKEAFGVLNLALFGSGQQFEAAQVEAAAKNAATVIGPDPQSTGHGDPDIDLDDVWAESPADAAGQLRQAVRHAADLPLNSDSRPYIMLYQTPLAGQIGNHSFSGEADLIALRPTARDATSSGTDPAVEALIIDCKSTTDERATHRIQIAAYALLLEQTLGTDSTVPDYQATGSVITKAEAAANGDELSPFDRSTFELTDWAVYVEHLLSQDGPVDETMETRLDELPFSLNPVCDNCAYREACTVRSIEDPAAPASLAMLGLDPSVQAALADCGITNIRELSELIPNRVNPKPNADPPELPLEPARRRALEDALPGGVHETIQRAQSLRGAIDPEYPEYTVPPLIAGKGWVPLPDDRVTDWGGIDGRPPGELIRIGLVVRPDSAIDRIAALGACVTANNLDEPVTISELIDAVPEDETVADTVEAALFERFTDSLFEAIEQVATDLETPRDAVIHFYTYSEYERRTLVERLDQQDTSESVRALRSLLGLRAAGQTELDQPMVSAVQPIIEEYFATKYPSRGLLTTVRQFDPWWTVLDFDPMDARPDDPSIWRIFDYHFTDDRVPYLESDHGIRAHIGPKPLGEGPTADVAPADRVGEPSPDGWYPIRRRAGAQFPLEYLWAVTPKQPGDATPRLNPERIDDWNLDDDHRDLYLQEINRFRYRTNDHDDPITRDDVEYLIERLSATLIHLIDVIPYKNNYLQKTPVDATELSSFELGPMALPAAARDYLRMEFAARRDATHDHYHKSMPARVGTGRSLPIRCTDYEEADDGGLTIHAEFAHDQLITDPETAAAAVQQARIRGGDGAGSGSWRVLTRLARIEDDASATTTPDQRGTSHTNATTDGGTNTTPTPAMETAATTEPSFTEAHCDRSAAIEHSPPVLVEAIDSTTGEITLKAFSHRFERNGSRYRTDHCGWRTPDGSNLDDPEKPASDRSGYVRGRPPVEIDAGELYMLDPMIDDFGAPKAERALTPATVNENALYDHLDRLATTGLTAYCTLFEPTHIDAFVQTMETVDACISPNDDQTAFITDVSHAILALQGPPGTGKTSGAIAPALLARAFARAEETNAFAGVVVAPSHEAVDTLLDQVVARLAELRTEDNCLPELELARILPSDPDALPSRADDDTPSVSVTYASYHTEAGTDTLSRIATTYCDPQQRRDDPRQCLLFTTPATLYNVLGTFASSLDTIDGTTAPAAMRHATGLFDLLCIDEASMLDMPNFLLAGSALKPTGQTLITGDHRQLSTVTEHDWHDETRPPIQSMKPNLSVIDYVNWLNTRASGSLTPADESDCSTDPEPEPGAKGSNTNDDETTEREGGESVDE